MAQNMTQKLRNWDYNLPKDWRPNTEHQWLWYLERKINYDDWEGLKKKQIAEHWEALKDRLDPAKRAMLELYLQKHE